MKLILLALLLLNLQTSWSMETLPELPDENLISNIEDKKIILEALKIDLIYKGKRTCLKGKTGVTWHIVNYFLTKEEKVLLYVFEGEQPLIILRSKKLDHSRVNYIDFRFYTNESMTIIEAIKFEEYLNIHQRVNVGTLIRPIFKNQASVKSLGISDCI